jgi:hypothetical protein
MDFETGRKEEWTRRKRYREEKGRNWGLIIGRDCKELTELEIICNNGTKRI